MDSHDLPRSLLPARVPSARPQVGHHSIATTGAAEASASPQIMRSAVRGIKRYWWLILGIWVIGSLGAGALIYTKVEPLYESESYLRVEDKQQTLYVGATNNDLKIFLETLVQLIRSSNVLAAAAVDPTVADLPRLRQAGDVVIELRKVLTVQTIPGTYLIAVSMSSRDPNEAALIVNAVVNSFLRANREWSDGMTTAQITNLEGYLNELQRQSEDYESRWKELVKKGDVDSQVFPQKPAGGPAGEEKGKAQPDNSRSMVTINEFKNVQARFNATDLEIVATQSLVDDIRHSVELSKGKEIEADTKQTLQQMQRMFQTDPEAIDLGDKMLAAKAKAAEAAGYSNQMGDPAERKHHQAYVKLKNAYEQLWQSKADLYREQIRTKGIDPTVEIREAEVKLRRLRHEKEALGAQMKDLRVASSKLATDEVEISLIRDALETIRNMRDAVHRKLDDLKFSAKDGARIRLNNPAVPAGRPRSDSRMKYLAMTPVGVLLAVLGLAVALELRSARVSDPDFLSTRVRHEVFPIAPLPNIRAGEDSKSGRSEQKLARFVQSLDHLRVALCDGGIPGQGRCVLITSATGGEGKTTLSAHLAARCANAGTSIILIDADMRRASLGRLLDVPAGPGLADVLNGDVEVGDVVSTVQAGGFHFLSAGSAALDPSRILTANRLAPLIEHLRGIYDLVLIDSPPILPVPDALLMGRHVDGVVMASRFDASRLPLVERASRQLAAANIPVLGMVVNGANPQSSEYGNYHYAYQYPSRHEQRQDEPGPMTS